MTWGGRPLVLGHRGARREAPENTLPAFRRALEMGADGVELDARLSADGQVIVFHDDRLERTTDGRGAVACASWDELRCLDAGSHFSPTFAGTRICTLAEALEVLQPARLVNIELKGPDEDTGLERRVLEVVRRAGLEGRVVFSSFVVEHLRRLRALDGGAALAWLYNWPWQTEAALALAGEVELWGLHPAVRAVRAGLVCRAHQRGLRVLPWTVNAEATVRRLARWGADGVITDRPSEVRRWLEQAIGR